MNVSEEKGALNLSGCIILRPPSMAGAVEQIFTSHNRRLSEMAVGLEVGSLLLPLTACGNIWCGAPNPPRSPSRRALSDILVFGSTRDEGELSVRVSSIALHEAFIRDA